MRVLYRHGVLVSLVLTLASGCGWLRDDKGLFVDARDDYLDAKPGKPLQLPDGLDEDSVTDPFPIPPTPEQANANYYPDRPPLPDAIYGDDKSEEVRIQRIGDRRWLVVPDEPVAVWPKLKQFFAENGVRIVNEKPEHGRIDTQWLLLDDSANRDLVRRLLKEEKTESGATVERLLIKVERGLSERTTEIHVRHLQQPAAALIAPVAIPQLDSLFEAPTTPPAAAELPTPAYEPDLHALTSTTTAAETGMLQEVGAYIAAKVSEQLVSMIATNIQTQAKAFVGRDENGVPALRLNLDFERAWASVSQALDNAELEVTESLQSERRFEIKVSDATFTGQEPGFFGRLFSFGDRSDTYTLQIRPAPDAASDAYWVNVLDEQQQPPQRDISQQILVLVREYAG